MFENPFYDGMAAAAAQQQQKGDPRANSRRISVSARKLAASLWELQEIPLPRGAACNSLKEPRRQPPQQPSQLISATLSAKKNTSRWQRVSTAASGQVAIRSFKRSVIHCKVDGMCDVQEQTEARDRSIAPPDSGPHAKPVLDDGRPGPPTSSDLLQVLNTLWKSEERSHSRTSTFKTLRARLERAHSHAGELTVERKSHRKDIENLMTTFAELEAVSEEGAEKAAIQFVREDLEDERNAKRKLSSFTRVSKEIIDVKTSL